MQSDLGGTVQQIRIIQKNGECIFNVRIVNNTVLNATFQNNKNNNKPFITEMTNERYYE